MSEINQPTPAEDPIALQKEIHRLIVKAGRRCAYDLLHAAGTQKDAAEGEIYERRARMWLGIFNPADEGKSYRDRLHMDIMQLEGQVEKYRKWFESRAIPDPYPEDIF